MSTVRKNMQAKSKTTYTLLFRILGFCRIATVVFLAVLLMAAYCQCAQQAKEDNGDDKITSSKQSEIQDFIEKLGNNTDTNLVKTYRHKIEGYLEGTERRYEDAENE